MHTININGTQICFDDQGLGDGPAILLLTGWGHDHRTFDELLSHLLPRHRVVRMDWRGHGLDRTPVPDFGLAEQVADVVALLDALDIGAFIPVTHAHAGWVALEAADRLGAGRVPRILLIDLLMTPAPPEFLDGIRAFQDRDTWQASRMRFLRAWLAGSTNQAVNRHIREEMGGFGFDVWARAGRVIETAYRAWGSPMERMKQLAEPRPIRHVFSGAASTGYDALHERFHQEHPWFTYRRLDGRTHFPALELPEQVAGELDALLSAE